MEKRRFGTKKVLLVAVAVLIVGGGGYLAGLTKHSYDTQAYMINANAAMLAERISLLAELRAGQTEEVARILRFPIDNLVAMAACRPGRGVGASIDDFDPEKLPSHQLSVLKLARAYTQAVPEPPLSERSQKLLRKVDPTDTTSCSPALQALLESASKK